MQFWITDNIIKKKSDKAEDKKLSNEANMTDIENKNILNPNENRKENMNFIIDKDSITTPLLEKV